MKRELMWLPFLGWGLALFQPIFINRSDHKTPCAARSKSAAAIRAGFQHHDVPGRHAHRRRNAQNTNSAARSSQSRPRARAAVAHNAGLLWPRNSFLNTRQSDGVIANHGQRRPDARATDAQGRGLDRRTGRDLVRARAKTMQLELPLAAAPVAYPRARCGYIQLGSEIVGYRFRRGRRRSIGIVMTTTGCAWLRRPYADRRSRVLYPRKSALGAQKTFRVAPRPKRRW